jgi:uncharacterized protein YkwD
MKVFFLSLLLILNSASTQQVVSGLDQKEARLMFDYLQQLRQKDVPSNDPLLKYVPKNAVKLIWNDTLAAVAEARATDLATRNYFDHIDRKGRGVNYYIAEAGYQLEPEWIENKDYNFFESLEAGKETYKEIIADLIIDKGVPSKGHRKHLLGLDDWNSKNTDVGIACFRVGDDMKAEYSTYTVIIIARHQW